jgi:hypothetical protein
VEALYIEIGEVRKVGGVRDSLARHVRSGTSIGGSGRIRSNIRPLRVFGTPSFCEQCPLLDSCKDNVDAMCGFYSLALSNELCVGVGLLTSHGPSIAVHRPKFRCRSTPG